jgi:hypothetical protein
MLAIELELDDALLSLLVVGLNVLVVLVEVDDVLPMPNWLSN